MQKLDDWYEINITYEFEEVILKGTADYLVATGSRVPQMPYFFLQKFKPSKPTGDPEIQLLAQLLTALAINGKTLIKGGLIVGQLWHFAFLEKKGDQYFYYISPALDALIPEKLHQIYRNLQAVKAEALAEVN